MDSGLARRDLEYYGTKFNFEMMFFGRLTFAINWLRFGRSDFADSVFDLAFNHQVGNWNVWRELAAGLAHPGTGGGAVNFLTGAGAFLQAFLFGYIGLQPESDGLVLDPVLPAHADNVSAIGVWFGGCSCDVFFNSTQMRLRSAKAGCLAVKDGITNTTRPLTTSPTTMPRSRVVLVRAAAVPLKTTDDSLSAAAASPKKVVLWMANPHPI